MKRPRILYFVAAWSCLGLLLQASAVVKLFGFSQLEDGVIKAALSSVWLGACAFVLWHTVGLINMRRFHRWFAFTFFLVWTVAQLWLCSTAIYRGTVRVLPALLIMSVFITPNLLAAWYLSRQQFRQFAVQFAAERESAKHSRAMQEISQKKISGEIRS